MGSIVLTEQLVENYIKCDKLITKGPRKEYSEQAGSRRNRFSAKACNNDWEFDIFIRQLVKFPEYFSIGLKITNSPIGEITLLRCNGAHGPTRKGDMQYEHHEHPHLHVNDVISINNGNTSKPAFREITTEYLDLDTGIIYFCRLCRINDFEKYFDLNKQLDFLNELQGD